MFDFSTVSTRPFACPGICWELENMDETVIQGSKLRSLESCGPLGFCQSRGGLKWEKVTVLINTVGCHSLRQ